MKWLAEISPLERAKCVLAALLYCSLFMVFYAEARAMDYFGHYTRIDGEYFILTCSLMGMVALSWGSYLSLALAKFSRGQLTLSGLLFTGGMIAAYYAASLLREWQVHQFMRYCCGCGL